MINLDIQDGKSFVYRSTSPISVSRIGDVVLLLNDLKDPHCRHPWEFLFKTRKLETFGGSLSVYNKNILRMEAEQLYDADLMPPLFEENSMYLAVLQGGADMSLCLLMGKFCGYRVNEKSIFDFSVNRSEIFYNR